MNIFVDIETGRDVFLTDAWVSSRYYSAPSNWKDPIKIEAEIAKKKQADIDGAALNLQLLKIGVITYAIDDEPVVTLVNHGMSETTMLETFFAALKPIDTLITFDGARFDIPAIRHRALNRKVRFPHILRPQKPWDPGQFDLRYYLTGGDKQIKGRLIDYCHLAGVPGPIPHDGANTAKLINNNSYDLPIQECESDVEALRNLYYAVAETGWI